MHGLTVELDPLLLGPYDASDYRSHSAAYDRPNRGTINPSNDTADTGKPILITPSLTPTATPY